MNPRSRLTSISLFIFAIAAIISVAQVVRTISRAPRQVSAQEIIPLATAPVGVDPILVGAGDIARCDLNGDELTALLLDDIVRERPDAIIFTAGDNVYNRGTLGEFANCYDPTWGRHKARTRPSPGNHDFATRRAAPYYAYFGANAGPAGRGYYSYDLGTWHIISLNSNIPVGAGSLQEKWLREDLTANKARCTLAYWHHPLFSSGPHGNDERMRDLWRALYDFGADMVIGGHDHDYERFAPQSPDGKAEPKRGIREFVVGTGGAQPYIFISVQPNSEMRGTNVWGLLKLTLHPTSYDWEFVPIKGQNFRDSGRGECVEANPT
jgi:3',5'-cyclic AMP phosphodiesterase CpdA